MSSSGRAPIFILSCYRTGSTLMRYIFDTHPDVYSPPEVSLGDAAAQLAHLEAGLIGFKLDLARLDQLPAESVAGIRAVLGGRMDAATANGSGAKRARPIWLPSACCGSSSPRRVSSASTAMRLMWCSRFSAG